jgi:hypothetical protein
MSRTRPKRAQSILSLVLLALVARIHGRASAADVREGVDGRNRCGHDGKAWFHRAVPSRAGLLRSSVVTCPAAVGAPA